MNNVIKAKFTTKDDKHTGYMPNRLILSKDRQEILQANDDRIKRDHNEGVMRRFSIK